MGPSVSIKPMKTAKAMLRNLRLGNKPKPGVPLDRKEVQLEERCGERSADPHTKSRTHTHTVHVLKSAADFG